MWESFLSISNISIEPHLLCHMVQDLSLIVILCIIFLDSSSLNEFLIEMVLQLLYILNPFSFRVFSTFKLKSVSPYFFSCCVYWTNSSRFDRGIFLYKKHCTICENIQNRFVSEPESSSKRSIYSKEILIGYIPTLEVQLSCVIMKLESSHKFSSYCIKSTKKYLHVLKSVGI